MQIFLVTIHEKSLARFWLYTTKYESGWSLKWEESKKVRRLTTLIMACNSATLPLIRFQWYFLLPVPPKYCRNCRPFNACRFAVILFLFCDKFSGYPVKKKKKKTCGKVWVFGGFFLFFQAKDQHLHEIFIYIYI
jgi:hypothetical protein